MEGIFGFCELHKGLVEYASEYLIRLGYTRKDINNTWEIVKEGNLLNVANEKMYKDISDIIRRYKKNHPESEDITPHDLFSIITL